MTDEEYILVQISRHQETIDDHSVLMNDKMVEYLNLKGWKVTPLIFGCCNYESPTGRVVDDLDSAFQIEMNNKAKNKA